MLHMLFKDIATNEKNTAAMSKAAFLRFIQLPVSTKFCAIEDRINNFFIRESLAWEHLNIFDIRTRT